MVLLTASHSRELKEFNTLIRTSASALWALVVEDLSTVGEPGSPAGEADLREKVVARERLLNRLKRLSDVPDDV